MAQDHKPCVVKGCPSPGEHKLWGKAEHPVTGGLIPVEVDICTQHMKALVDDSVLSFSVRHG